jgi:succinate dehydrogenase/fumarate reductase flavoprotein subunit
MSNETDHDVIVLGSGIAGLATAVAARKLGLRTLLLEVADRSGSGATTWPRPRASRTIQQPSATT